MATHRLSRARPLSLEQYHRLLVITDAVLEIRQRPMGDVFSARSDHASATTRNLIAYAARMLCPDLSLNDIGWFLHQGHAHVIYGINAIARKPELAFPVIEKCKALFGENS
jgi:hypothetical protein